MKQLSLIQNKKYRGRKTARAFSRRAFHHVTMKARFPILRRHHAAIRPIIRETQLRYGVRIRALAIMENHLHFLMEAPTREGFSHFLRVLAGKVALRIGRGKLWAQRAWSRIVRPGRDFLGVRRYIDANPVKAGCFDETDVFRLKKGILELGPD